MPTFRLLIAAGMGVALALNSIQPSASQTAPPTTSAKPNSSPEAIPTSGDGQKQGKDLTSAASSETATAPSGGSQTPIKTGDNKQSPINVNISQSLPTPPGLPPDRPFGTKTRPDKGQPAPEDLNPNPNPLQFPTKPEEVEILGTQPITLQQAIELARRNNRELQVAEQQLERSRAQLREALAAEYPSLTLGADITRTDSAAQQLQNQRLEQLGQIGNSTVNRSLSGQLELSYDLYTSGRRSGNINAAERQVRAGELEVERIDEQLRLDVANAYYDIQESQEQIRISQQAVKSAEQSLRDAESLEKAGVGTRFDVLQAQVQLANETQNLAQGVRDRQIRQRRLAQILSLSLPMAISTADPVEVAGYWNLSLEESIIEAFKRRAELEQQLVQREISEEQRRVALANVRPQVSVFANYNILDSFGDQLGVADGYSVGARLRWNLFDGGAATARARQEDRNRDIAETRFAGQRSQVRFEVEQAYYDLRTNFENIQTASVEVERAREALRLARLRFQAGVGTQTDVIQSETQLTRSEANRVKAILGYNRALATIQRAVSNIPPGELTTSPP